MCLLLIFVISFLVPSCKKEVTNLPAPDGEKIVYGQNVNLFSYYPDTFNPFLTGIRENYDILMLVYEPLFAVNENGAASACLAAAASFENNNLTVRIRLRDDVVFQSGEKFSADDVIFTLKYIAEYAPEFLYVLDNVKSYSKDGADVIFNLKTPQFNFVSCLDFPIICKNTDINAFNGGSYQKNGCGAFLVDTQSVRQKEMRLVKNENYYNSDLPYFSSVTVSFLKEPSVAVSAFNGSEISALTSDEFVWGDVSFTNDHTIFEYGGEWFYFLAVNYENALIGDVNVRKIINSALDKQDMVQKVFQTHAYAANSILNPAYNYGAAYSNEFDLDNAALYAKEADIADKNRDGVYEKVIDDTSFSLSFDVLVNGDDAKLSEIADFVSEGAKKAKIRFNLKRLSGDDYLAALDKKDYDILVSKERIRAGDNLSAKVDFNGKYSVPYEIYESLAKTLGEATDKNTNEKMREFDSGYMSLLPCIALCYSSSALICQYSLKNMSAWQNGRYRGILEGFIKY